MDTNTIITLIAIGLGVLFALALYGIITGKVKGPRCGCGTGVCGRPVDEDERGAGCGGVGGHGDERLSAKNPPSDEELSIDASMKNEK